MPKWGDLSAEDQLKIYEAVAEVYKKHENPKGLADPGCSGEYVNILMAKQKQDAVKPLVIRGSFKPD